MTRPQPKKSDLPVRAASAVVMVAVAGTALWLGGWVWTAFVAAVALGVLWEWGKLSSAIASNVWAKVIWFFAGLVYIGVACHVLIKFRGQDLGFETILTVVGAVVAVDVGAYFSGRTFGGAKIAPKISPSKTWSGLFGGMAGAAIVLIFATYLEHHRDIVAYQNYVKMYGIPDDWSSLSWHWGSALLAGCFTAITAQTGDFFESWMKRRAGVKDSGSLIPGHGGLFDRVDGLLAVCFVLGLVSISYHLLIARGVAFSAAIQ